MIQKMINGMTVSQWASITFSRNIQDSVAHTFCTELAQMCQVSGMVVFHLLWFLVFEVWTKFLEIQSFFVVGT